MGKNQDLKNAALAALEGNWAPAVLCNAVMFVISLLISLLSVIFEVSLGSVSPEDVDLLMLGLSMAISLASIFLLTMPLCVGSYYTHNRLYAEDDNAMTGNMFRDSFHGYWKNVLGMFLMMLYVMLWCILLIVPGFIMGLAYSMTPYILKDCPELSAHQAIKLSRKMMKGHKWEFFWLQLSFIGWIILGFLTLGIGYLWLMPYLLTTNAAFYQKIKKQYNTINL